MERNRLRTGRVLPAGQTAIIPIAMHAFLLLEQPKRKIAGRRTRKKKKQRYFRHSWTVAHDPSCIPPL